MNSNYPDADNRMASMKMKPAVARGMRDNRTTGLSDGIPMIHGSLTGPTTPARLRGAAQSMSQRMANFTMGSVKLGRTSPSSGGAYKAGSVKLGGKR